MDLASFSLEILIFLFFISTVAGFLDTLVGGGGLLAVPALMLSGMPPIYVLGTNKLQGSMGTGAATLLLLRRKELHWENIKPLMLASFIGAAIGSIIIQFMDAEILSFVIPCVLGFIAIYFIFAPEPKKKQRLSNNSYQNVVVPAIAGYDGMFGPGTGSFFVLAGVAIKKLDIIKSTVIAKPLNFSSNIASLIVFLSFGHVVWVIGILMMSGQAIGAFLGTHYLFKVNPKAIRILIVIMSLAMLIRYSFTIDWLD
ncbi:MAG: TSUP family transporter [Candidatus Thioglobus sp.]|jgi:uncharacterized membrane protein YfcA|nr:TSUP family transporter [Candidatus Thioglobus sp.]